jgi:hypothetical protein
VEKAIITAVAGGVPYYQACLLADVPQSTATLWMEKGEGRHSQQRPTPQLVAFVAAIKKAETQDEARRLLRISQAGEGGVVVSEKTTRYPDGRVVTEVQRTVPQWQAHAWMLERKYPDRYGRRVQADLAVQVRQVAEEVAQEVGLSADEILAEAQRYLHEHDRRRLR